MRKPYPVSPGVQLPPAGNRREAICTHTPSCKGACQVVRLTLARDLTPIPLSHGERGLNPHPLRNATSVVCRDAAIKNKSNFLLNIDRGCPLSIEYESCSIWYPGDTQERGVPRTAKQAEVGGETSPPEFYIALITVSQS